jgi:hypothetical protein
MQTRNSSPPQAPASDAPPPPPPEATGKAQWSEADEIALIEYISERKAEAGDGMKFKASFWSGAAKEMASHCAWGGVKTPLGCSGKWDRVRTSNRRSQTLLLTYIYPAQEIIQRRCYAQSQYVRVQLERGQGPRHHDQ